MKKVQEDNNTVLGPRRFHKSRRHLVWHIFLEDLRRAGLVRDTHDRCYLIMCCMYVINTNTCFTSVIINSCMFAFIIKHPNLSCKARDDYKL